MRLSLGPRAYDLTARALVLGVVGCPASVGEAVEEGADIVEVGDVDGPVAAGVPVCVAVREGRGPEAALAAGASLLRLEGAPSASAYEACAEAGVAVVVADTDAGSAELAGIRPDRIVVVDGDPHGPYPVLVDVTGSSSPTAATSVAVVRGARIVRTGDMRGARRICDVLAEVMDREAGR